MIEEDSYPTLAIKSGEVDSIVRHHRLTFAAACEMVVLTESDYIHNTPAIGWVPTPDQIQAAAEDLQNGDVVIDGASQERWEKERKLKSDLAAMEAAMPWLFVESPGQSQEAVGSERTAFSQVARDGTEIIMGRIPNIEPAECPKCGKAFRNPAAMRMHSRECQGVFVKPANECFAK